MIVGHPVPVTARKGRTGIAQSGRSGTAGIGPRAWCPDRDRHNAGWAGENGARVTEGSAGPESRKPPHGRSGGADVTSVSGAGITGADPVGPRAARRRRVRRGLPFGALVAAGVLIGLGVLSGLGAVRPTGPVGSEQSLRDASGRRAEGLHHRAGVRRQRRQPGRPRPGAPPSPGSGRATWSRPSLSRRSWPSCRVPSADPGRAGDPDAVVLTTQGTDGRCYSVAEINLARRGTGPAGTYYRATGGEPGRMPSPGTAGSPGRRPPSDRSGLRRSVGGGVVSRSTRLATTVGTVPAAHGVRCGTPTDRWS